MKKITLLLTLLMTSIEFSQAIPVTFQSDIITGAKSGASITPADANWYSDSGLTSTTVEDLASDSPDHMNAGKIVSSSTGAKWQNAQLLMTDNYMDLTTTKTITLDVYSDNAQDFLLKVEESLGTGANTEKSFSHNGSGWETIMVDYSTPPTGQPVPNDQYKLLVIFPCYSAGFTAAAFDSTTYVDNITTVVWDAITAPATPTANAPTPPTRVATDVISIFSDAYTNVNVTNLNPNWGQSGLNSANTAFDPTGGGTNTVLEYTNFNYQGVEFDAQDVSDMENLHVDVWTDTAGAVLKVTPINNATVGTGVVEFLVGVSIVNAGWSSVDLPISSFTCMTWDNVHQLKFDGQSGTNPSNIYVDNIYFWNAPTASVDDFFLRP
tara:strand:+ start:1687 stop:2826 length:1140 start_codon:yes stop_codon:yes gene_type:complete